MKNITFIYAGAGSGKTHKLTELLFEKINNQEISSNEVMLTTFTKKAANEIKERAQAKLLEKNFFEEANKLNQAYIGTVHSVGYQFIKKYWYLLGISPDIKEIGDNEKEVFFSKAISEIPTDNELKSIINLVFDFNFQNNFNSFEPNKWIFDVKSIMELALTNQIDLENEDTGLTHSLHVQKSIFKGEKTNLEIIHSLKSTIEILRTNPPKRSNKSYDALIEECIELDKINENNLNDISFLFEMDDFFKKLKSISKDANYQAGINQIIEIDISQTQLFQEKVIAYTTLIFELAKKSLDKYTTFKKQKGLIDFTDMEVYFLKLLEIEEVKADISKSIKLVMVDEFQDSNPIQLTIFMKLSELVQQSYWVGDPKQAIYGFRGADPVLIDRVMEKFTQKNDANLKVEMLKMSWRSAAPLVHFSNSIFSTSLQNQVSDIYLEDRNQLHGKEEDDTFNSWKKHVTIQPLSGKETISLFPSRTDDQQIKGMPNLNFLHVLKNGTNDLVKASKDYLHHTIGKQIKQMLTSEEITVFDKSLGQHRKLVGSDICLLTSSNTDVSELASEFSQLGLSVNALIPGLNQTIEYRFVKDIAILLLDKNNVLAKTELAFLNGEKRDWQSLMKERIDFILESSQIEEEEERKEYFKSWLATNDFNLLIQSILQHTSHLSVAFVIREIINHFNLFLKTAAFGNVATRQSNLLRIIELVDEYEESCIKMNIGTGLADFFNFIESSEMNNTQKGNSNIHAIQVMTYHKAKGLEWPIVYLLSLEKDHFRNFIQNKYFSISVFNQGDFSIEQPLQHRVIEFLWWPFGTKTSPNEVLSTELENSSIYAQKQVQTLNELKRVMYVGITRSRDALFFAAYQKKNLSWLENVIPGFDFENSYNTNSLETSYNVILDLFNTNQEIKYTKVVQEEKEYEAIPFESIQYFKKEIPVIQVKAYVLNPSKQKPSTQMEIVELVRLHDRLSFSAVETDILGNTLHAMLYAKSKPYFERNATTLNANNGLGLDVSQFIKNTKQFEDYIQTQFHPIHQFPELHLEKKIGGKLAVGESDLVLELENELVLIDYKSFPGKKEDIFATSSEFYAGKYSGQLQLYSEMLSVHSPKPITRKLIYYVVQGVIVEIK